VCARACVRGSAIFACAHAHVRMYGHACVNAGAFECPCPALVRVYACLVKALSTSAHTHARKLTHTQMSTHDRYVCMRALQQGPGGFAYHAVHVCKYRSMAAGTASRCTHWQQDPGPHTTQHTMDPDISRSRR